MPGPQQVAQALVGVKWLWFKEAGGWELLVPAKRVLRLVLWEDGPGGGWRGDAGKEEGLTRIQHQL